MKTITDFPQLRQCLLYFLFNLPSSNFSSISQTNFLILESIGSWGGFHSQILKKPVLWDNGYVIPPKEPGLGVELNVEVAMAHTYDEKDLHLEMAENPIH